MRQQRNGNHTAEHQQDKNRSEIKMNICGTAPVLGTDAGDLDLSSRLKQVKTKTFAMDASALTMVLGVMGTIMLLAACMYRGLYFPSAVYGVILFFSGTFLMGVIMLLLLRVMRSKKNKTLKIRINRDIDSNEEMKTRDLHMNLNGWIIWPIIMMICYGLHACLGSVSTQGSMDEMLRWSLLAIFALLAGLLASCAHGVRWFAVGWQAAGSLLVFSGLLAVCGVLPLPFAVMRTADPEISSAGARLGGLLQYPNAYGAVAGMYALERLAAVTRAMARPVTAWRLIAAALPLMPAQAALLLSESRGAWLATGLAASAFAWQRRGDRLPLLLAMAAPLASAAWLYRQLVAAQLAPAPVPGLLALAGAWAAALLGTLLLCRLWHSGARARTAALTAMALAVTTAAMLAVASTAERLAAGVGTGLSRLRMWRDALELWSGAAWLGHGGDAWRSMFRAIQSSPYVGGEVHNGLIDIALDTGLLGLIIICAWFAFTIRNTVKYASWLMPSMLVFVLHGIMDFDWSFTLVWMLFIWLGAWSYAYKNEQRIAITDEHTVIQERQVPVADTNERSVQPSLLSKEFSYQAVRRTMRTIPWLTALAILIWLGGTVWLAGRNNLAEVEYRLVRSAPQEMNQHRAELTAAFHANPYRPEITISLSRTLSANDAEKLLLSSLSHSPAEPQLYQELGKLAAQAGQGAQAGKYFEQAIALNRYDSHIQSAALYWMIHASRQEWAAGYTNRARQTAAAGVRMYEHYEQLNARVAAAKTRNDRQFTLDDNAAIYITQLRILASTAIP
ncbi:O-antigen ligase family protein [Paenibacillus sp. ACRRY]|uniref:O-antigen ligase family protein n=1 Tax=Paenibacillus sp. ACRRY TaxID=2918208 RepID=UPI001EF48987|nr:O-antigen ligase family protein [Paenibacillus sp. ACRRY]MCG7385794.1 O-antigen ligase family protein [Paenibacillus sp. ACRRY]